MSSTLFFECVISAWLILLVSQSQALLTESTDLVHLYSGCLYVSVYPLGKIFISIL